jgi:hypothetical protein
LKCERRLGSERGDLAAPDTTQKNVPYLPVPKGLAPGRFVSGTELKGECRLLTLFTRTGQIAINQNMPFDAANIGTANYNSGLPFLAAQQGVSEGP